MNSTSTAPRHSERIGRHLAAPLALLGSLFAIALMLYAVDTTPLWSFLAVP